MQTNGLDPAFHYGELQKRERTVRRTVVFNVFSVYIVRARLKFNVFAISFDAKALHYETIVETFYNSMDFKLPFSSRHFFIFHFFLFLYCIFISFSESLLLFFFFQIIVRSNKSRILLLFISGCLYRYRQSREIYSALEYLTRQVV